MVGLVKHASSIYTVTIFRDFDEEFTAAIACSVTMLSQVQSKEKSYFVSNASITGCEGTVKYTDSKGRISVQCTCKNFEETGWLCCHCLRILHLHSIQQIPDEYITQRWTKWAKKDVWERFYEGKKSRKGFSDSQTPSKMPIIPWRYDMSRNFYNLILMAQENKETRAILETSYKNAHEEISKLVVKTTQQHKLVYETTRNQSVEQQEVRDPERIITKGRCKRVKGHFELSRKRNSVLRKKEFGTVTPNKHVI